MATNAAMGHMHEHGQSATAAPIICMLPFAAAAIVLDAGRGEATWVDMEAAGIGLAAAGLDITAVLIRA